MGTSSVTVQRYADTIYSDGSFDPDRRAKPPEADWRTARDFRNLAIADPPGQWASNRYQQARRLTGTVYVAVQAIMDLAGGSSVTLLRRVRKAASRTTFGPGDSVAKSTPLSQQRGRDEDYVPFEDYDHPLAKMTRTPNPNESMGEWMAKVIMQNQLHGIGPVWAVGSESRPDRPVELWCLRAPFMYPLYQYTPQYPNGAWRINPYRAPGWAGVLPSGMGSAGAVIPAEDVKRFVNPHPLIDFDGYGAVEAGAVQLDTHDSVDVSRKSAMERGLNLDTVIIAPGMGDPQVQTMKDGLESRHMGPERARRVAILAPPPDNGPGQKFAIEQLGNSPRDMDYPQGWEQSLTSVLALFGVPKIVACLGESGSYAEGYAAWQQFHGRQENYLARFATWYDRSFCDPWEEYTDQFCLRITPKPIDDKDLAEKKHSRQCQNGTVTLDESRAKDDLPPWPDPEIGRMLLPVALAKLQQDAMPQPQPGALPVDTAEGDDSSAPLATLPFGAKPDSGPPRPKNDGGKGSLPQRVAKTAMSSLVGSAGGFLVPAAAGRMQRKRKRGLRGFLRKSLKALEG